MASEGTAEPRKKTHGPEYALIVSIAIALLVSGGMLLGLVPSPF